MTITHLTGVNVELVTLLCKVNIAYLLTKVFLREGLGLGLITLLQKVRGLYLSGTGCNRGYLTGLAVDLDMYLDGIRGSTGTDRCIGCLLLELLDILLGRVRDHSLDNVTYHRKRYTDRGDNLCVLRDGVLKTHLLRAVWNEGSCTTAAADELHRVVVELVLIGECIDAGIDLLEVLIEDLGCELLDGDAELIGYRLHALTCCTCITMCEVLLIDETEYVRCIGVGEADTLAACKLHCDVIGRIAWLRAQHLDGQWACIDLLLRCEACVFAACDMCGTRSDILYAVVVDTNHGTTGTAEDTYVEGVDIGIMSTDLCVVNTRTTILDDADVGRGATYLEVDCIGRTKVHEGTHNGCGRAGQCRQDRTLTHLADLHNTTITTHDHERNGDTGIPNGGLGCVCGRHHLRKDGSIDRCRTCTTGQTIELRDIGRHGNRKALCLCEVVDLHLFVHVIYTEGHGSDDYLGTLTTELLDRRVDLLVGQLLLLQEAIVYRDLTADLLVEHDVLQVQLTLREEALDSATCDANDTNGSDITLDEGIGRLCGRVRYENDVLRGDVVLLHTVLKGLNDTGCYAVLIVMCGFYLVLTDDLVGKVIHSDTLGVGSTYVDTHTNSTML